jgi:hypothetical protein
MAAIRADSGFDSPLTLATYSHLPDPLVAEESPCRSGFSINVTDTVHVLSGEHQRLSTIH